MPLNPFFRSLLIYLVVAVVALAAGLALSDAMDRDSLLMLGLAAGVLVLPLVLKWHHLVLVTLMNSGFIVFFAPGKPFLWVGLAAATLFFAVLNRSLRKQTLFIRVPSISRPLLVFGAVILATLVIRGGVGGQAFGSDLWGGRRYLLMFGAILAYFALTSRPLPVGKESFYGQIFFLIGVLIILTDIAYAAGSAMGWVFFFFSEESVANNLLSAGDVQRYGASSTAALAVMSFLFCRYGLTGVIDLRKGWRLLLFLAVLFGGMFGGFRSLLVLIVMLSGVLFFLEGLHRTSLTIKLGLVAGIVFSALILFSDQLPLSVQRSISFLPVKVDAAAESDASGSTSWRLEIWRIVLPQVPDYLLVGKGLAYSGSELTHAQAMIDRNMFRAYEWALVGGWYHNGPLSVIMFFGIPGVLAFGWFIVASIKLFHANYKWSPPELRRLNTFLYALFLVRLVFFLLFYGQIELDLISFTSIVGLSVAVNRGIRRRESPVVRQGIPLLSARQAA